MRRAAALVLAVNLAAPVAGAQIAVTGPDARRDRYWEIVGLYARGQRAEALEALARWNERDLSRRLDELGADVRNAEGCPSCPRTRLLLAMPLRAAVMLHADRDEAERDAVPGLAPGSGSFFAARRRPCPPAAKAWIAGQYAGLLTRFAATRDFARRFFLAMTLRCQWGYCLEEASRWGREGLRHFPEDSELLFALGSAFEQEATLLEDTPERHIGSLPPGQRERARAERSEREHGLTEARRYFERAAAAAADPGLARLHLGRVLWQLRESALALGTLEAAWPELRDAQARSLAQLFMGRLHEDAGRLEAASACYRLARDLEPGAQSAAVALAQAQRLAGDQAGARETLTAALAQAGRRGGRDGYWQYLWGDPLRVEELFDALRLEARE